MASALAVRIIEEGVEPATDQFWLSVRTFFCNTPGTIVEVDTVRFFFARGASLVQMRNALQDAIIAKAQAQWGFAIAPTEILLPSFQKGA